MKGSSPRRAATVPASDSNDGHADDSVPVGAPRTHWPASAVLLGQWALPTVGFAVLVRQRGGVPDGWFVLVAPMFFIVGALLARPRGHAPRTSDDVARRLGTFLRVAFCVLLTLATVHFSAVGIPLFSENVETVRFDVGSSGLFGLPSRGVLYATPCVALIALATCSRGTRGPVLAVWTLFLATQIALGFKGALIEVVSISAIGWFARSARLKVREVGGVAFGGMLAVAYVQYVAQRYATLAGGATGLTYVMKRATTDAIEAGYTALAIPIRFRPDGSMFIYDMSVLIDRYLNINGAARYTLDQLVSATVTGTPVGPGAFLVPVTLGGPVYLLEAVSLVPAICILIALGFAWVYSLHWILGGRGMAHIVVAAACIYAIRVFLMNGNGAYVFINIALTCVILAGCLLIAAVAGHGSRRGA